MSGLHPNADIQNIAEDRHLRATETWMFKIEEVGEPGWLDTPVTVVATTSMSFEEKRLKPHSLHVARVEEWLLKVEHGERFELAVPSGVKPAVGETLELEAVMRDKPLRSKWTKIDVTPVLSSSWS